MYRARVLLYDCVQLAWLYETVIGKLPYHIIVYSQLHLISGESPYKLFLAFDSFLLHLLFSIVLLLLPILFMQ